MRGVVEARQNRAGWAFVAPALALIGVFFFVPVLAGLFLSFTDFDIYAIGRPDTARFMGLENYRQVLSNPLFWQALGNTFLFVILGGPLSVLTSLLAALLVSAAARQPNTTCIMIRPRRMHVAFIFPYRIVHNHKLTSILYASVASVSTFRPKIPI